VRFISIPFIAFLLQGIPEVIGVVTLAFVIAKIPLEWSKIVMIGIALASISYVMRMFNIPFGIHTISEIILLFLALTWLAKGEFSLSLISSLLSFLVLVTVEYLCLSLLMPIFGVTPETLFSHLVTRIMITEPQVILIFIAAFLLNKFYRMRLEV